jgi:hypothetical protein
MFLEFHEAVKGLVNKSNKKPLNGYQVKLPIILQAISESDNFINLSENYIIPVACCEPIFAATRQE